MSEIVERSMKVERCFVNEICLGMVQNLHLTPYGEEIFKTMVVNISQDCNQCHLKGIKVLPEMKSTLQELI